MSTSRKSPPPGCPMHEAASLTPDTAPLSSARCPSNSDSPHMDDALSSDNYMPKLSQEPAPGQQMTLPTSRVTSSIPKATRKDSENDAQQQHWEYPSPQQFYNALTRKGWETPEESIEMMVDIHNYLNEMAWREVLKWESKKKCDCDGPKLLSLRGRPQELSPKARILQWTSKLFPSLGTPPPFDRHDWIVDRCGRKVRYVIDYYSGPDEGDVPVFYLDVRPALDSVESVVDRARAVSAAAFERLRARMYTRGDSGEQ